MLHENPLMIDTDVDHWRNLQSLFLDSAKGKPRIIIIHDQGEIQKFAHTAHADIVRPISKITNPKADAEAVYKANAGVCDFVMVIDRRSSDEYFKRVQNAWSPTEDLDEYVSRAFSLYNAYPDGIVAYPGSAATQLGLQWRLGASHAAIKAAAAAFVPPSSRVLFGVFEGDALWTSLILGFDADGRINVVTTIDAAELTVKTGRAAIAKEATAWTAKTYGAVSIALFAGLSTVRKFLAETDKLSVLREARQAGDLIADPLPASLAKLLADI